MHTEAIQDFVGILILAIRGENNDDLLLSYRGLVEDSQGQ